MTTNHIEHLDEALIRPGRADKKVYFQLADRMISTQPFHTVFKQLVDHKESKHKFGKEMIERLANDFASKVPERFSVQLKFVVPTGAEELAFGAAASVETG
ncbi:hypothetical protein N7501_003840 [Penicillium viridicatum]|nr:hypothetical protein N7501_003840 [Penicillium viridicatum]